MNNKKNTSNKKSTNNKKDTSKDTGRQNTGTAMEDNTVYKKQNAQNNEDKSMTNSNNTQKDGPDENGSHPVDDLKPGSIADEGGTYEETGPRGGSVKNGRTIRMDEGGRMPPTSKEGDSWSLVED